ncbi:PLAC8 family-domain-containing protein [Xylariaceae sp. FL1272]|nr:PLAC8 family-domain-containing protein [Xylariaceae sp. FL1272]
MSANTGKQSAARALLDDADVQFWTDALNEVAENPAASLMSSSPAGAGSWFTSFFSCLDPFDECLVTWCLPSVTFGKTHHRMNKGANLVGYKPVNTSCLFFCGASHCGAWWLPTLLQRVEIRKRYNLQGNFLLDLATACCCHACVLVQNGKEVAHRAGASKPDTTGYEANHDAMTFPTGPHN